MAVLTGLAGKERWKDVKEVLRSQYHAGPYMEKFVLEALFHIGAEDIALERMKNRYAEMVNSETTTLWEVWERNFNQSVNHGWTGGPLALMMQYVAGISPLKPEFQLFSVKPQLGSLKEVNAKVPTKYGEIDLYVKKDVQKFHMILKKPVATEALIELPIKEYGEKSIYFNGEKITSKALKSNKEIKKVYKDEKLLSQLKGGKEWDIAIY